MCAWASRVSCTALRGCCTPPTRCRLVGASPSRISFFGTSRRRRRRTFHQHHAIDGVLENVTFARSPTSLFILSSALTIPKISSTIYRAALAFSITSTTLRWEKLHFHSWSVSQTQRNLEGLFVAYITSIVLA